MQVLRLLFGLSDPVNRKTYIVAGFSLAALKYALDSALVYATTGKIWTPLAYLSPTLFFRQEVVGSRPEWLLWLMAFYTLPFAWIGLSMSVRRAADSGQSPWFGVGFLVPIFNWFTILNLCIFRSDKGAWQSNSDRDTVPVDLRTVMLTLAIGVALTLAMVAFSVELLGEYGWALFIGTPLAVGMTAGFLANRVERRPVGVTIGLAVTSICLGGVALLLFALEGVICLLMAAIPAVVLGIGGSLIGRAIAISASPRRASSLNAVAAVLFLPILAGTEKLDRSTTSYEVETAVEIDASPLEVWPHVIDFPDLPPPSGLVQWSGIAYPLRARLEGEGVGAVRHCEFSTGPFVEPITVWQPGERLAFDVVSQPHPMKEWSPYQKLHPPHLDGYFRSKRGEFRFVELPEGRTRLEGSTWYEIDISPSAYWSMIADLVIHRIHLRVLRHVKRETEK